MAHLIELTRRQQYAAFALQGILATSPELSAEITAKMAFICADAMIKAERPEKFSEQEGDASDYSR